MYASNMWRKWHNQQNAGPPLATPMLVETNMEETYLETIPEVDSIKSKRSSASVTLPDLPFNAGGPAVYRSEHNEPAWSQPSPTIPQYHFEPERYAQDGSYDVSPPSTPPKSWDERSSGDAVSPVEPVQQPALVHEPIHATQHQSQIPRRIAPGLPRVKRKSDGEREQTKWDPYSGEPNASGVPASTRPGVVPLEQQYPQLKEKTKQILAGLREREQAKKQTWGRQPSPTAPESIKPARKEVWTNPDGRAALVDPAGDSLSAQRAPERIPQRDIGHQDLQPSLTLETRLSEHTIRNVPSDESIKPIAPLRIRSRDPTPTQLQYSESDRSPSPLEAMIPKVLQSPFRSPGAHRIHDQPMPLMSARTESPQDAHSPDTPRTPTPEPYYEPAPKNQPLHSMEHEVSRFSWTTYATSVTDSPGSVPHMMRSESPPPPMPVMPTIHKRVTSARYNEHLYMDSEAARSRGSIVVRKPVPNRRRTESTPPISALSLSKTLPQVPPVLEADNKISVFEAQLESLARRKHNINRIVKDLSENLKKNQINYNIYQRKEVESKINHHKTELQSIVSEEHELNLVMHRAIKKRDRDECYEQPAGLWVRRVTS